MRFLLSTCDIETINKRTLAATPYSFSPSYAKVLHKGMAAAGAGAGNGNSRGASSGRGFGGGHGGGCLGGGGGGAVRGGRQGYGARYDYNHHI